MATITTTYQGDMLFETQIGSHSLRIDVPSGMGGSDRGPMPPQLFIASIGSCVAALVAEYCEKHDIDTTGLRVDVSFDKEEKPARLVNIKAVVTLPNADVHAKEAAVRRVAEHCPVHETIVDMQPMEIEIRDRSDLSLTDPAPTALRNI
ncbi:MAG: OsmC family protein [Chloroflexota bacterium]